MNLIEDYEPFVDLEGTQYYFVRLVKPNKLLCWLPYSDRVVKEARCMGLRVEQINVQELKRINVWNKLPKKVQTDVEEAIERKKNEATERMAHARKGRKKKYDFSDLPDVLTCECGKTAKPNGLIFYGYL